MLKKIIKLLIKPLYHRKENNIELENINNYREKVIYKWREKGSPIPPPHELKQQVIKDYQQKYGYNILIETGTYLGDMVEAQRRNFKHVFSIELSLDLWRNAVNKFKDSKNITILQGDSSKVLNNITSKLNEPAIFWLDGHYSAGITAKGDKECPILEEIDAIFTYKKLNHVILIDDARCFIGEGDYPTIEFLTNYIKLKQPFYSFVVKDDIIRCEIKSNY